MDKMARLKLAQKVLAYLKKYSQKKAVEISKDLDVDKHDVNSILYAELKNELRQDKDYKWSLINKNGPPIDLESQILECLRKEQNLKAIDIARKLKVDRKDINFMLYGKLSKKCVKDDKNRWAISL